MVEEGGDWDRRNRFKVYEGLFELSIRNFEKAAKNFLDTVATFTSQELIDFNRFVTYAVLAAMLELKRNELKLKVCAQCALHTFNFVPAAECKKEEIK